MEVYDFAISLMAMTVFVFCVTVCIRRLAVLLSTRRFRGRVYDPYTRRLLFPQAVKAR